MTTIQKLHKSILKIKNKVIAAINYLQLQEAINQFNKIKTKNMFKRQSIQNLQIHKKKSKQQLQIIQQKNQLLDTTQLLIQQKIKYFKKIALKKIFHIKKQAKNKKSVSPQSNNNLTLTSPKKKKFQLPCFSQAKQLSQLKALQQKSVELQKTLNLSRKKSKKSRSKSQKRLKQSKSMDNLFFDKVKESFTFRNQQNNQKTRNKNEALNHSQGYCQSQKGTNDMTQFYEGFDDDKTQIKIFNKKGQQQRWQQQNRRQDAEYYKGKVQFLQKIMQSLKYGLPDNQLGGNISSMDTNQIFEQYHYKLRQKSLQLQEIRGRLKYYQANSQQLRNRIMNEQRRNDDYINELKQHIKQQQCKIYQNEKEKKVMNELIKEYQLKIQVQDKEKIKYLQQIQTLLKQRQKQKINQKSNIKDLRQQLQIISKQQTNIQQLQNLIRQQRIQTNILIQKNKCLQKDLQFYKEQLKNNKKQRQILEELLQLKLQEIQQYKLQVFQLKRNNKQLQDQNKNMRQQIQTMIKQQEQGEKKKEKLMNKKVQKLKQVKSLLAQDV